MRYCDTEKLENVDFLPADERILQSDTFIVDVCVARHDQITQNNKFAVSMQHLKKEVSDDIDFLHTGTHKACFKLML